MSLPRRDREARVSPMSSPRPISLLIFDLDGTLVDSREDIAAAANHALRALRMPERPVEAIVGFVGDGVPRLMARALGPGREDLVEGAVGLFRAYYADHLLDASRLYPGVRETLEHFRSKPLAVVSNKPGAFTYGVLGGLGIADYFAVVVGGDGPTGRKPDPAPVGAVLARVGVPPQEAVVVGDSPVDVQVARAAGTTACAVTYGFRSREDLEAARPDFLIDDLRDLIALFR